MSMVILMSEYEYSGRKRLIRKLVLIPGIIIVLIGILMMVVYGTLPYVGSVYIGFGALVVLIGLLWLRKAWRKIKESEAEEEVYGYYDDDRTYAISYLAILIGSALARLGLLYTPNHWCYIMYQRVVYMEYVMIGMLVGAGLLALLPALLARTPVGPLFTGLESLAGTMVLILIFVFLLIFPLDPMFVGVNTKEQTCYINPLMLKTNGPVLLRLIFWIFTPPQPPS